MDEVRGSRVLVIKGSAYCKLLERYGTDLGEVDRNDKLQEDFFLVPMEKLVEIPVLPKTSEEGLW